MRRRESMVFIWVSGKYHSKDKYGLSVERLKKKASIGRGRGKMSRHLQKGQQTPRCEVKSVWRPLGGHSWLLTLTFK